MDTLTTLKEMNIPAVGKKLVLNGTVLEIVEVHEEVVFARRPGKKKTIALDAAVDNQGVAYIPGIQMVWDKKLLDIGIFVDTTELEAIQAAKARAKARA